MEVRQVQPASVPDLTLRSESGARPQNNPELIHAVKAINAAGFYGAESELAFALDRRTQKPVIRLVDRETRKVIQQIPSELALSLAESLRDRGRG
jgi:uncharacterized FlaG/YvyC family protein